MIIEWMSALGISTSDLFRIIVISASTIGGVYIGGRLLGIVKTDNGKNRLAGALLFIISGCITWLYHPHIGGVNDFALNLWDTFIYGCIGAIPYIWFWWKSADRVDSELDKIGLKDKIKYKKTKNRK